MGDSRRETDEATPAPCLSRETASVRSSVHLPLDDGLPAHHDTAALSVFTTGTTLDAMMPMLSARNMFLRRHTL